MTDIENLGPTYKLLYGGHPEYPTALFWGCCREEGGLEVEIPIFGMGWFDDTTMLLYDPGETEPLCEIKLPRTGEGRSHKFKGPVIPEKPYKIINWYE